MSDQDPRAAQREVAFQELQRARWRVLITVVLIVFCFCVSIYSTNTIGARGAELRFVLAVLCLIAGHVEASRLKRAHARWLALK